MLFGRSPPNSMPLTRPQTLGKSIGFGLAAGVVFAVAEIVAALIMNEPAIMPIRMVASIALGEIALTSGSLGLVISVGLLLHFALSALFGLLYGAMVVLFSQNTRASYAGQALLGLMFGVTLWFVNFQLIARSAYPWLHATPELLQATLHAVAFGLPLGGLLASAQRRRARHPRPQEFTYT
jgi:hypothetical protein